MAVDTTEEIYYLNKTGGGNKKESGMKQGEKGKGRLKTQGKSEHEKHENSMTIKSKHGPKLHKTQDHRGKSVCGKHCVVLAVLFLSK